MHHFGRGQDFDRDFTLAFVLGLDSGFIQDSDQGSGLDSVTESE